MNQNRRTFIKVTSLASATLVPIVGTLAQVLGKKEEEISTLLGGSFNTDLEFHIIDNNLLNLHFYFINVERGRSSLTPKDENQYSFMIVRLPQMHVSEKGYWKDDWNDAAHPEKRFPSATLSGYSYLAFQLWPDKLSEDKKSKNPNPNKKLNFTLESVLDWNNENNFELITLVEWFDLKKSDSFAFADYTKCDEFNNQKVWDSTKIDFEKEFDDSYYIMDKIEPSKSFNFKKYKSLIRHFLDQNLKPVPSVNSFIPITFLEFPQGVILVPIARDEKGDLAKGEKKPRKEFWSNKYVNQKQSNSTYRKYEVWNNTLYYKTKIQSEGNQETFKIETPSFRIAGLITNDKVVCPDSTEKTCEEASAAGKAQGVLPSLLDKTELAFLTQFALGEGEKFKKFDFRNKEYDIKEVNGLFFTGLGIITHLKYYNENCPPGIDLIEYEHIITEGRDIFIKVARIGIHNKNGKRYKHVIEGKRKIDLKQIIINGIIHEDQPTSFIELKQYCECIEKKKNYELTPEEIALWNNKEFDSPSFSNQSNEIFTPASTNKAHFRRFPWKEIRTIEKKRIPIDLLKDKNDGTPIVITDPECAFWFWPILEGTKDNPKYLHSEFDADDWDKGTLNIKTPFIFIRKSLIEANNPAQLKEIADSYFQHISDEPNHPANLRRAISINNQKIAFTKPLPVKDEKGLTVKQKTELLNESKSKTHIIETEFVEPYYNIHNSIKDFYDTKFPLLPQTLRAKVFIDHIKDLAQDKISSVVQYHEDYLNHVFDEYTKPANIVLGNGAKLILENTVAFRKGVEEPVNNTYQKISNALHEAKDRLGNLAVPDIIPESISLEKLGITAPNEIKKSIEQGRTVLGNVENGIQKISSFNPRELLRGKLSDVCGLDLTAILDELIPADSSNNQTPLFEINKIINKITDEINGSQVYQEIKTDIDKVKKIIENFERDYTKLANDINGKEHELVDNLKQLSNSIPNSDELNNLIKGLFEQYKTDAFKLLLSQVKLEDIKSEIGAVKTAAIKYFEDEKNILSEEFELNKKKLDDYFNVEYYKAEIEIFAHLPVALKEITSGVLVQNYLKQELLPKYDAIKSDWDKFYKASVENLFDTIADSTEIKIGSEIVYYVSNPDKAVSSITYELTNDSAKGNPLWVFDSADVTKGKYVQLENKVKTLQAFLIKNINGNTFQQKASAEIQKLIISYSSTLDAIKKEVNKFQVETLGTVSKNIDDWKKRADKYLTVTENILPETRDSIIKFQGLILKANPYIDFLKKFDPYYYYNEQQRLQKDLADLQSRFQKTFYDLYLKIVSNVNDSYEKTLVPIYNAYVKIIIEFKKAQDILEKAKIKLEQHLITETDYQTILDQYNDILKRYNDAKQLFATTQSNIVDYLKIEANKTVSNYIQGLKDNSEVKKVFEAIYGDGTDANIGLIKEVKGIKVLYENKYKDYLDYVKAEGSKAEQSIYDAIGTYIANHPDEVEKVREAQNIYRLLTSIKQQDLTYNWSTDRFRDINFGIVSFKKFSNPNTTLKVDVKATTYFTSGKFPPAIEKVVTYSENRFTNFGISFFNSLTVNFNEISFIAGSDHSTHFDVKIKDVKFDGALSFVQAFESWLQTMGKGLILQLHGDHVALGYSLAIPAIKTPGFNIFNLSLNFDLRVYFDKRPLRFGFSLARPDSKFGIAVGIYAGFGFFGIIADPKKGIVEIDCALEAGAWAGISIGPISGEVKLAFGFRYTKNEFGVRLEGYIVAEGRLTVWILEVSARIYLGIVSENSYVEGVCTVTYSVKLGFISKSFSGSFHKKIAGASSNNQGEHTKTLRQFGVDMNLITVSESSYTGEALLASLTKKAEGEEVLETNPVSRENWAKFINVF